MIRPFAHLLSSAGASARLSVLIFHSVCREPDPMFPGNIHARQFDELLIWLKDWFHVLPLPEAVELLREGRLPARALAITFDDGYADNHDVAMPILQRHGLHATFFIATGFLNGGCMWNDRIIEAVRRSARDVIDVGVCGQHRLGDWAARRRAAEALIGRIKYLDFDERLTAVEQVVHACAAALPGDLMMQDEQVRGLHRAGMEIGAHTRLHPILARLSAAHAQAEIAQGRAELESLIGARVGLFAYPNGRPHEDYTAAHVAMVRELGFDAAVSTARGASRHGDDLFQIRRFTPWDQTRLRFGARMLQNLVQAEAVKLVA